MIFPSAPRVGMSVAYYPAADSGHGGRSFPALVSAVDGYGGAKIIAFNDDGSVHFAGYVAEEHRWQKAGADPATARWSFVDLS